MKTIWLDSIDSTNTEALRNLAQYPDGTVLAAREQTAGRGQRGNTWFSEPGKNLTFSIILKWEPGRMQAADAHWLNYVISEAIAVFLQGSGVEASIKWPNDIYVGSRKICGILIENLLDGPCVKASVIGVGLNINQQDFPQLANATSLACSTGRQYRLEPCLEQLLAIFERLLPSLSTESLRTGLFERYSTRLFRKGRRARYHDYLTDEEYWGLLEGVEPDGRLRILDLDTRQDRYYRFKEVGYIL